MPYPTEHACRVRDPADFRRGSFRRVRRKSGARPLDAIMGRLAEDGSAMVLQSYRYPKEDWTASQARRHCRDHEGGTFEPAKSPSRAMDARHSSRAQDTECEPCKESPMTERLTHSREVVLERQEQPNTQGGYRATIFVNERARQGPDLSLDGLQVDNYMRNPVVLWAHDMSGKSQSAGLPIGRTNRMTNENGKLEVDFEFLDGDPFADRVRNAWDQGFLKAASVSWLPLESEEAENGSQRDIRSDLLEWSIVSVPSDPDAIRTAHSRLMETMLSEAISDDDALGQIFRDTEDAESQTEAEGNAEASSHAEDTAKMQSPAEPDTNQRAEGPCWEGNKNCAIGQKMAEYEDAESAESADDGRAPDDAERLTKLADIVKEIKSTLRGATNE